MPLYLTQKLSQCLEHLIGENTPQNHTRLKVSALIACMGVTPANRERLGGRTKEKLQLLDAALTNGTFQEIKTHLIQFILESQQDFGRSSITLPSTSFDRLTLPSSPPDT
jgi:hypothetical protein